MAKESNKPKTTPVVQVEQNDHTGNVRSNFQPFNDKRDEKDGNDQDLSTEPEMIKAFRDTWQRGGGSEAFALDMNPLVSSWIKNDHLGFVVWYFEDGAPKRYYPDFVVKLANGAHVVVETKGQKDKSAQIKRKALQSWVKAVNSMGTWGKWFEVFSTHPGDLEGLLGNLYSMK